MRIEKTEELSDDSVSDDDEKTLSLSNDNVLLEKESEDKVNDTDNDGDEDVEFGLEVVIISTSDLWGAMDSSLNRDVKDWGWELLVVAPVGVLLNGICLRLRR